MRSAARFVSFSCAVLLLGCNVVLGLEDHELVPGGSCKDQSFGAPTPLAEAEAGPIAVVVDDDHVFWATGNDHAIRSRARTPGATAETIAATTHTATALALDAVNVYFTDSDLGEICDTSYVHGVSKVGGAITELWNNTYCGGNDPLGLATDGTSVYFSVPTGQFAVDPVNAGSAVFKGEVTHQAVAILAYDIPEPQAVALFGPWLYFVARDDPGASAGSVRRVRKDADPDATGGAIVVSGVGLPVALGFDAQRGYVSAESSNESRIYAFDPESGATTLLAIDVAGATDIAVDDGHVYWCNPQSGEVRAVCKGGGTSSLVAEGQGGPAGIAADSSGVYWANRSGGQVMMAARN